MGVKFDFKDNSDLIIGKFFKATEEAVEDAKLVAVEAVQEQMLYGYKDRHGKDGHTEIVDTGALFDSLEGKIVRVSQNAYTISVGSPLKYAKFVHNGTSKLKARPFIRDGLMKKRKEIEQAMKAPYKNA